MMDPSAKQTVVTTAGNEEEEYQNQMQVFANQQRAAQEKHNMKGEDSASRDVSKRGASKRQKLSQDSSKTISRYLDDDGEDLNASDLQD